jgi:AraC-like DNA-binding protein
LARIHMNVINLYKCQPGFATAERIFDYDYLLYVHQGRGVFRVGSIACQAGMGDLFYCPPGVANTILADRADPFLLSGIEFVAPEFREALGRRHSLLSRRFLIDIIGQMVTEYRYGKSGSQEICNALLSALLFSLKRAEKNRGEGCDPAEAMVEYIAENFHRGVTHQELSEVFRYHKNTVNRMLESKTGLSLKNYLIFLRIRRAEELLKYSDRSMGEIAELCGYGSQVFFARQFREQTGLTPSEYRRRQRGGAI